jgi:NADPH:quinone reductase-like Zn-dependent oxidoreductase
MKAIVQSAYSCDPDVVLIASEVDRPTVGRDEVLVHVCAASVWLGGFGRSLRAVLPFPFVSQRLTMLASTRTA